MKDLGSLVTQAQAGDLQAYGEIVRRFQDMAYGYACAVLGDFHLAEDVAQEAFIEAYRCLSSLREPAAFAGWLRRIVFKQCDRLTRRKQVSTVPLESADSVTSESPGPPEEVEQQEMEREVLEAVLSLPENERTVTALYYIDGYSQKEVAEFLEVPVTTVNNRLHASRERLKERMVTMVADTLRSKAPKPEEARDRVRFLLGFGERIGKGQPVLAALCALSDETESTELRDVIRCLQEAVSAGRSVSEALAERADLFPPMVLSLIEDGERFGILDQTMPLAGLWLRDGQFSVDPNLFADTLTFKTRRYVREAKNAGATEIVIDSTQVGRHPDDPKAPVVWVEHVMFDGTRKRADYMHPGSFSHISEEMRSLTVLDQHQEGDIMRGTLFPDMVPGGAQGAALPVSYHPLRNGEVIRIRLVPQ